MATGDVDNKVRPRFVPRQRLDADDADALSLVSSLISDFNTRALVSKTQATSAQATGEIWTGGSCTGNPVAPNDGLLRVNSELFVGLDADGHTVVKPTSVTLQVAIPLGVYQVYLYDQDVQSKTAVRRFITALGPFVEIPQATDTEFVSSANVFVRAGNAATIIPDTTISGQTTPLLFLGIATNVAGAVTFDQSSAVSRLSTCPGAPTLPVDNSHNGSMATLVDMQKALLYLGSRIKWKDSTHYTPSAVNNFGSYQDPIAGLDVTYRKTPGYITIGNGVTVHGDYDQSDYASDDLLMQAAINALPNTIGGTIAIKQGVNLVNMAGPILVSKNLHLVGTDPFASIIFGPSGILASTAGVSLRLQGLNIICQATCIQLGDGNFVAEDCRFRGISTVTPIIQVAGGVTPASNITIKNCYFSASTIADSSTVVTMFSAVGVPLTNTLITGCRFELDSAAANLVHIADMRSNVKFVSCDFRFMTNVAVLTNRGTALLLGSQSNGIAGDISGRVVQNCSFQGNLTDASVNYAFAAIRGSNPISHLTIAGSTFLRCTGLSLLGGSSEIAITDCRFIKTGLFVESVGGDGTIKNMTVNETLFQNSPIQIYPTSDVVNMSFDTCRFLNTVGGSILSPLDVASVNGSVFNLKIRKCIIEGIPFQDSVKVSTALTNGHEITGFEFVGNDVYGFSNSTTDNVVLGVSVHTFQQNNTRVSGNIFRDIQNVTYNGTGNDMDNGGFRLCEFSGYIILGLVVHENQFRNVARTLSPAAGKKICSGHYIRVTAHIATQPTNEWDGILITNNVFGDFGCKCNPLVIDGGKVSDPVNQDLRSLKFSDNMCNYSYPPTTELFPWLGDIQIKWNGSNPPVIVISDNTFSVGNTFGAAQRNIIEISGPGALLLQITGNKFSCSNFDYTAGWGVGSSAGIAVDELVFCKNVGSRTVAGTIGTHGMTTLDGSLPVVPGLGVAWPDNIKFINN